MSGSTIGGIVGAAVGYYVGGSQGAQVGWMVGSAVGGEVDPDVIKGQRLTDAQQQTSAEGAPRPIVYGTVVVAGNIIHAGPLVEHKDSARTGKGGPVQESYRYTRTYAIRVCEGPIGNISRIWRDDKLVYDVRDPAQWPSTDGVFATAIRALAGDTARFGSGITIYSGSETQIPDPTLEALPAANGGGVGNVCAHRGTCYVVFADDDLTDRQGAIPQYRFEVSCCGDTTTTQNTVDWVVGQDGSEEPVSDTDINGLTAVIACGLRTLCRSSDGGVTWQTGQVEGTSLPDVEELVSIWHVEDPTESAGTWYIAGRLQIVVSYDDAVSFTDYLTPVHELSFGNGVWKANGTAYAGAYETVNTVIFEVLNLGDTDIDLGADYGRVTSIGDLGSTLIVGTDQGNIVSTDGTVRYAYGSANNINQFAWGLNRAVATMGGGYATSLDGGGTWDFHSGATTHGVVFARGVFYMKTVADVLSSSTPEDPTSWVVATDALNGLEAGIGRLCSDGFSLLATTVYGNTAVLPSAYVIPDTSGWHIDNVGNVVGDIVTSVDRCVAQLDATVLDICDRAGVPAAKVDVTQLTDDLRGFVIGQPISASDALRTLQQGYFFDFPEWGDWPDTGTKLRAIKRGGANVFALTDDDLVDSDEDQDTREQVVEFPRKINLITSDVDSDYNPTKQTFTRRTGNVKAVGEQSMQLALSTLRTEAAPMVDIMGKVAWEEALGEAERELPEDFTQYTPSDCGTLNGKRHRLERAELGDGTVKWTLRRDRASAYVSNATPGDAPTPTPPVSTLRGPTKFAAMNLPSLRVADNVPGMYIAVCGLLDGWIGCDLQLSVDEGLTYDSVAVITNEATMGTLAAACDSGATDLITASVLHGHELDSVTLAQLAAKANGFAITTLGTSEVGQFQTATETATTGTYDLTGLARGQLGTTAAIHRQGDAFVLLDGKLLFLPLDISLAGRTLYFRPVSLGTVAANNAVYQVVFRPLFTSAAVIDFYETELGEVITTESGDYLQVD